MVMGDGERQGEVMGDGERQGDRETQSEAEENGEDEEMHEFIIRGTEGEAEGERQIGGQNEAWAVGCGGDMDATDGEEFVDVCCR